MAEGKIRGGFFGMFFAGSFGYIPEPGGDDDMNLDIQTFTSDGTWTKPANALSCQILIVDGGTGGDGGGYDAGNLPGNGYAGGYAAMWQIPAAFIPATVTVTVGAGGAGGAGAVDANIGSGVAGGASSFGTLTAAADLIMMFDFLTDKAALSGAGVGKIDNSSNSGGQGGDVDGAGNDGSDSIAFFGPSDPAYWPTKGTGGVAGANGTAGGALMVGGGGGGGGGGAVTATSAGGNGGAGGAYGGGGGGGGSGDGTFTGGNGGAGADGVVIVWTVTK